MDHRFPAVLLAALVLHLTAGCSHAAPDGGPPARTAAAVPVPRGLGRCAADGPSASGMDRMVSALGGRPLGCFQSGETTELHGSKKTYAVPVEYGFAVEIKGGPYTTTDVNALMADVTDGWKNARPLSEDTRADYERRLDGLIEKGAPVGTPKPADSVNPSVLVSVEQLDPESFAVVAIRQRQVPLNGEFFSITKVDASAVVLSRGKMMRLSIARELRSGSDVTAAREEIADWAYAVANGRQ
jgi:hypothetical protein